ncbi:MAG: cupin domain-containing protein [Variibacter sp.]|nr:cupin domain-containing protein [Variibacter sp.]
MEGTIETHRRVVVVDDGERSKVIADGPSPDIRRDPARPGFMLSRMWVSDSTPVRLKGLRESLHLPHTLEPPPGGSTCYMVTFPPDSAFRGKVGSREVEAYFAAMGSPGASTYSAKAPHPYMQKTRTLDFCLILEGEITLVLDTEEVHLKAGDIVVQRGTNHAWSNRSNRPCVVAFSVHDAVP